VLTPDVLPLFLVPENLREPFLSFPITNVYQKELAARAGGGGGGGGEGGQGREEQQEKHPRRQEDSIFLTDFLIL